MKKLLMSLGVSTTAIGVAVLLILPSLGNCQSLPRLEHQGRSLSNNSYIYLVDIGEGRLSLKCLTDNTTCCNDSTVGGWRDERGKTFNLLENETTCLYVTREYGVISLQHKRNCSDYTSGLWRCDIPDFSGEMQSLYVYIGQGNNGELAVFVYIHLNTSTFNRTTESLGVYELYSTH